jgi:hypothetical protein
METIKSILFVGVVMSIKILLLAGIFLGQQGCGSDDKGASSSEAKKEEVSEVSKPHSVALKDRSKLPACDEANETALAFIISEDVFVTCSQGDWVEIDVEDVVNNTTTQVAERLPDGMFDHEGERYYFSATALANYSISCPAGFNQITGISAVKAFTDSYLADYFPEVSLTPTAICLENSGGSSHYNSISKTSFTSLSGCRVLCKKQ